MFIDSHAHIDGPEFDAHQVDFRELADRLSAYKSWERSAMDRYEQNVCHATGRAEEENR